MEPVYHPAQFPSAKTCLRCQTEKPLDAFKVDRSKPDGRYPKCKQCEKQQRDARSEEEKQRDYDAHHARYMAHREESIEKQRHVRLTEEHRERSRAYRRTEQYRASRRAQHHRKNDPKTAERRAQRTIDRQSARLVEKKFCPSCQTEKQRDDFHNARNRRDGLAPYCKQCIKEKTYTSRSPEKNREYQRTRKLNPDVRNHDRQVMRDWKQRNAEKLNEQARLKYATNAEYAHKMRKSTRAWMEKNPLKRREEIKRYQARKKSSTIGEVSYERVLERDGMYCYVCEQEILPHHKLEFDHVTPLIRGGSHSEDNVKVVHALCNRRKADKLLEEMTPFQRRGPAT